MTDAAKIATMREREKKGAYGDDSVGDGGTTAEKITPVLRLPPLRPLRWEVPVIVVVVEAAFSSRARAHTAVDKFSDAHVHSVLTDANCIMVNDVVVVVIILVVGGRCRLEGPRSRPSSVADMRLRCIASSVAANTRIRGIDSFMAKTTLGGTASFIASMRQ